MTTWHKEITEGLNWNGETWADVVYSTLTEEELTERFDPGFGREQGAPFTVWTADRVYFPACYDGAEWIAYVPRNPVDVKTDHVGGG